MNRRTLAMQVAWCNYGLPYRWGGDDPLKGFDCSGFVIEVLQSVGILPGKGDWTADALWRLFSLDLCIPKPIPGALAFWSYNPGGTKKHVELCIDEKHSIGASGGGSRVKTEEDAILWNAFVKVRPVCPRGSMGRIEFVDPFVTAPE